MASWQPFMSIHPLMEALRQAEHPGAAAPLPAPAFLSCQTRRARSHPHHMSLSASLDRRAKAAAH
jgi:hypothetical protein